MNSLDQLSNMPKEPQLGDKERKEQDNNDYQQLNTPLDEQRAELAQSLYGVKPKGVQSDNENINNEEEVKEKKDIQELGNLEDSQIVPVLDGLLEQGHVDIEIYNDIIKKLQSSSKEEEISVLEDSLSNIGGIDIKEKDKIIQNLKGVNEITEENFEKSDFFADFQNPENGSKPQGNDLDLLLAENYIKLPTIDGNNYNKKSNLNITFNTVLNKIIDKHSIDFKDHNSDIINEIRNSDNIGDKYISLQKLLKESKIEDSRGGSKQSKEYLKGKEGIKQNILSLQDKFDNLKKDIKISQDNNDNDKLKQLLEETKELKEEANESGDIFIASDIDLLLNETQETQKEQA